LIFELIVRWALRRHDKPVPKESPIRVSGRKTIRRRHCIGNPERTSRLNVAVRGEK
jgi:hypothetical protein